MELLDRYLQAVKFWLPKSQREDIIAESTVPVAKDIVGPGSNFDGASTGRLDSDQAGRQWRWLFRSDLRTFAPEASRGFRR